VRGYRLWIACFSNAVTFEVERLVVLDDRQRHAWNIPCPPRSLDQFSHTRRIRFSGVGEPSGADQKREQLHGPIF